MSIIERKRLSFSMSLPEATHSSLKLLADQRDMSIPKYIRSLIEKDIIAPLQRSENRWN